MDYSSLRLPVLLFLSALVILSGCAQAPSPLAAIDSEELARGRAVFESKGCGGCHLIEPPATAGTISDRLLTLGPVLWYAGSKFKDSFLKDWLRAPVAIRPMEYNSLVSRSSEMHRRLAAREAVAVASFLMSLTGAGLEAPIAVSEVGSLGPKLFNYKGACYGCHLVRTPRGLKVGGLSGPSLLGARDRLRAEWIYDYLSKPEAYPVRAMPNYVGIMTDAELVVLSAYVAGLE